MNKSELDAFVNVLEKIEEKLSSDWAKACQSLTYYLCDDFSVQIKW